MYIYQNGKFYVRHGNGLIGVEIYSDRIVEVAGTETEFSDVYDVCTPREMSARTHLDVDNPYIFPVERKSEPQPEIILESEVIKDEPIKPVKKPAGRPRK